MARISKDDETRTYVLRLDRSLPEASQTRWVYRLPTDADTSAAYKAGNQRVRGGVETDPVAYNFALCARVLVDVVCRVIELLAQLRLEYSPTPIR